MQKTGITEIPCTKGVTKDICEKITAMFKDIELKESLRKIAKEVYIEDFKKNNYLTFTPSKKGKRLLETNTD